MKHALKRILVLRDENVRFVPSLIGFPKRSSFDKGEHYIFRESCTRQGLRLEVKLKKHAAAAERTAKHAAAAERTAKRAAERTELRGWVCAARRNKIKETLEVLIYED